MSGATFYSFLKDIAVNAELLVANSLTLVPKCCLVDVVAERQKFDLGLEREASYTCALHMKTEKKQKLTIKNLAERRKFDLGDKDSQTCAMCIGIKSRKLKLESKELTER